MCGPTPSWRPTGSTPACGSSCGARTIRCSRTPSSTGGWRREQRSSNSTPTGSTSTGWARTGTGSRTGSRAAASWPSTVLYRTPRGRKSRGRSRATPPRRRRRSPGGTRASWSGSSSSRPRCAARCSCGAGWRTGRSVAQRCSVTPRTPWSRFRRRAPRSRSRTPTCSRSASPHTRTSSTRSPCTNGSGSRGPRSCRSRPRPPRRLLPSGRGGAARARRTLRDGARGAPVRHSPADLGVRRPGRARQRRRQDLQPNFFAQNRYRWARYLIAGTGAPIPTITTLPRGATRASSATERYASASRPSQICAS